MAAKKRPAGLVRFGLEREGPNVGLWTLVLLSTRFHRVRYVAEQRAALRHFTHLWLERQPRERYQWDQISALLHGGFTATLMMREPCDLPPAHLLSDRRLALSWRIPARYRELAAAASHATVMHDAKRFVGTELTLVKRDLIPADYERDVICD